MINWLLGFMVYIVIGYAYAERYRLECRNNVEEEFAVGAYWVALLLWPLIEIMAFFVKEKP